MVPVFGSTGPRWGPAAPLRDGFWLWTVTDTLRLAAFAPQGLEQAGHRRGAAVPLVGDTLELECSILPCIPATDLCRVPTPIPPLFRALSYPSSPLEGLWAQPGGVGLCVALEQPQERDRKVGRDQRWFLRCVGDFVGGRQALRPPRRADAQRCRTAEVYPTWSNGLASVSSADRFPLPSHGRDRGEPKREVRPFWWDAPSRHPTWTKRPGPAGAFGGGRRDIAQQIRDTRREVSLQTYGSCCACRGELQHRLL